MLECASASQWRLRRSLILIVDGSSCREGGEDKSVLGLRDDLRVPVRNLSCLGQEYVDRLQRSSHGRQWIALDCNSNHGHVGDRSLSS